MVSTSDCPARKENRGKVIFESKRSLEGSRKISIDNRFKSARCCDFSKQTLKPFTENQLKVIGIMYDNKANILAIQNSGIHSIQQINDIVKAIGGNRGKCELSTLFDNSSSYLPSDFKVISLFQDIIMGAWMETVSINQLFPAIRSDFTGYESKMLEHFKDYTVGEFLDRLIIKRSEYAVYLSLSRVPRDIKVSEFLDASWLVGTVPSFLLTKVEELDKVKTFRS